MAFQAAHRRAVLLLLSLAPLCRCSHEDASVLFQSHVEVTEGPAWSGKPVLLAPFATKQAFPPLPSLDGAAGKIKDAVMDVTKQVGEVSGHVEDMATKGIDWAEQNGLRATEQIVTTFDDLLGSVKVAADEVLERVTTGREKLQQALVSAGIHQEAGLPPTEVLTRRLLQKFSQIVNSFIDQSVSDYGMFSKAVRAGGAAVSQGLQKAGQKPLSTGLNSTLASAIIYIDNFKSQMLAVEGKLAAGGVKASGGLGQFLQSVSKGVCSSSEAITRFVDLFQTGFQNLCDRLTDTIASRLPADETAKIYEAMSTIQHTVSNIVWKLQSAKRELVLGVNQGIADVARTLRIEPSPVVTCSAQLPAPVVDMLEDSNARFFVRQSSANRAGQGLAVAVGLLVACSGALHL